LKAACGDQGGTNAEFALETWGKRSTDCMKIVYCWGNSKCDQCEFYSCGHQRSFYLSNCLSCTLGLRFIHHHPCSSHCHIQVYHCPLPQNHHVCKTSHIWKMHKRSKTTAHRCIIIILYVSRKEVIRNVNFSKLDAVIYKKFDELLKNKNKAFKKKHRGP